MTITDLAYDCIGEAFARNASGDFTQIRNFINSLASPFPEIADLDLMLAFKSFLIVLAEAQLARLYASLDPAGAKIHRNVSLHAKQGSTLAIRKSVAGLFLSPRHDDSLDTLPPFPSEELEKRFLERASTHDSIPVLLNALWEVLVRQSEYRRAVRLTDVVQMCKLVYLSHDGIEPEESPPNAADQLSASDIKQMSLQVEGVVKERIFLTYVVRGKLGIREGEALYNALVDYIRDWSAGDGAQKSLQQYLCLHVAVTDEEYESVYRTKLEYMLTIIRDEFQGRMMKEL